MPKLVLVEFAALMEQQAVWATQPRVDAEPTTTTAAATRLKGGVTTAIQAQTLVIKEALAGRAAMATTAPVRSATTTIKPPKPEFATPIAAALTTARTIPMTKLLPTHPAKLAARSTAPTAPTRTPTVAS